MDSYLTVTNCKEYSPANVFLRDGLDSRGLSADKATKLHRGILYVSGLPDGTIAVAHLDDRTPHAFAGLHSIQRLAFYDGRLQSKYGQSLVTISVGTTSSVIVSAKGFQTVVTAMGDKDASKLVPLAMLSSMLPTL
jgi:hypothetical protein